MLRLLNRRIALPRVPPLPLSGVVIFKPFWRCMFPFGVGCGLLALDVAFWRCTLLHMHCQKAGHTFLALEIKGCLDILIEKHSISHENSLKEFALCHYLHPSNFARFRYPDCCILAVFFVILFALILDMF